MTNTIETKTNEGANPVTAETPYIFLESDDSHKSGREILVAKKDWFKEIPCCEIRSSYGIAENDCYSKDENDGECCCATVTAYEYWDGSNHQHLVIAADWDVNFSTVTDETEIAEFTEIVKKAKHDNNYSFEDGSTGYRHAEIDGWQVTESIWQGAWEIYTITDNCED